MIPRIFTNTEDILAKGKVLLIFGARRVGKTTLLKKLLNDSGLKFKLDSGDNIRIQELLSSNDFNKILSYASGYELIAIDEAQEIKGIGMGLKILIDNLPELKIIATGSSSFDLAQKTGEPLTGRKRTITLFPISLIELKTQFNNYELNEQIEDYLIYGMYPEVLTSNSNSEKVEILDELVGSYLLKDILMHDKVKNSKLLSDLIKLLAFQVGNLVSFNELANKLGINIRTVSRYIDLLEKSYVIYRLSSYSKNLRNEISGKSKYYFYDNGIRNAIIKQFNEISLRNDIGALWENFIISERMKKLSYQRLIYNRYFWRNYNQQEIDLIEEVNGELKAYEIKWSKKKTKVPANFTKQYGETGFSIIHRGNYLDFVL